MDETHDTDADLPRDPCRALDRVQIPISTAKATIDCRRGCQTAGDEIVFISTVSDNNDRL